MVAVVKTGHPSSEEAEGFILTELRRSGVGRQAQSSDECVRIIVSGSQYDDKEQIEVLYDVMKQLIDRARVTVTPAPRWGPHANRFSVLK